MLKPWLTYHKLYPESCIFTIGSKVYDISQILHSFASQNVLTMYLFITRVFAIKAVVLILNIKNLPMVQSNGLLTICGLSVSVNWSLSNEYKTSLVFNLVNLIAMLQEKIY